MTEKQKELIKDNLNAYIANFGYISIEKDGKGFYIYTDAERKMRKEKAPEAGLNTVITLTILTVDYMERYRR